MKPSCAHIIPYFFVKNIFRFFFEGIGNPFGVLTIRPNSYEIFDNVLALALIEQL